MENIDHDNSNLAEVANSVLDAIEHNLNYLESKSQSPLLLKTAIQGVRSAISNAKEAIAEHHNKEVDEYNLLVDEAINLQQRLTQKSLELSLATKEKEQAIDEKNVLQSQARELSAAKAEIDGKEDIIAPLKQELSAAKAEIDRKERIIVSLKQELSAAKTKIGSKEHMVVSLKQELEAQKTGFGLLGQDLVESQSATEKAETRYRQQKQDANKTKEELKLAHSELKKLKLLQPERLKKKISELKKKCEEKDKTIATQKAKLGAPKANYFDIAKAQKDNKVLAHEVIALQKRLSFIDGTVHQKKYQNEGDTLACFIYMYAYGLDNECSDPTIELIHGLPWHLEVKSNSGLNVTISPTSWLQGFHPICNELAKEWPRMIADDIHKLIMERAEKTHPFLYERVLWAKSVKLSSLPSIDKNMLEVLNNAGFESIYSVVKFPQAAFKNTLKAYSPTQAKGIGDAAVKKLLDTLKHQVDAWTEARLVNEKTKQHTQRH